MNETNVELKEEIDIERKRVDNIVALPSGSTTGDAELMDIRVGANGVTYENAGNAVRGQFSQLSSELSNINIVDKATLENKRVTNTGEILEDTAYLLSPLIYCFGHDKVKMFYHNGISQYILSFYDMKGNFIKRETNSDATADLKRHSFEVEIPKSAYYFRYGIGIYGGTQILSKDAVGELFVYLFGDSYDLLGVKSYADLRGTSIDFVAGKYIEEDGIVYPHADWSYCPNYIPVNKGEIYYFRDVSITGYIVSLYDSNKNYVERIIEQSYCTIPDGVSFIRLSVYKTYLDTISLWKDEEPVIGRGVIDRLNSVEERLTTVQEKNVQKIIHVGNSYEFTRLRDGISEAIKYPNSKVYVHAGVYDLTQEFATEIAQATEKVGIKLKNNIHVIFERGAYVKALFDNSSRWVYDNFEPFSSSENDSFVLENLDIEASNTRYCVHDEHNGVGEYIHKYINCRMKYTNTHSDINYVQCIGGGLGKNGTIVIDGGYYESLTDYGIYTYGTHGTPENSQQPISFHNGYASNCNSRIIIKNVYLADRGYFRFGNYGESTIESNVEISNCSTGLPILNMYETTDSVNANFEIVAFNNTVRNEKVPFDFSRVIEIIES